MGNKHPQDPRKFETPDPYDTIAELELESNKYNRQLAAAEKLAEAGEDLSTKRVEWVNSNGRTIQEGWVVIRLEEWEKFLDALAEFHKAKEK